MTELASASYDRQSKGGLTFVIGLNLCLAGIYTNFGFHVGGRPATGVLVIAGAMFLVPHMVPHMRSLFWLGWLVFFLTVSLVAGGSGAVLFEKRLTSWLQIIVALGCAHIVLCAIVYPKTVRKTLFLWLMFIVVGMILETIFSPIRELSDAFRHVVFLKELLYVDDVRDLNIYGFVRPKLFTAEPSHVASGFVIFGAGWYVLSSLRRRFILMLICTILAILFLGSPFVLLALPLAWFLDRMASGHAVFGLVAAGVPLLGIVALILMRFSTRFADILSGKDTSFFVRFLGPYEVALKSIEQYPLFGVGIGAKPALDRHIDIVYSSFGSSWVDDHRLYLLNNAFANSLSFFGLAGAAIFFFLIARWAKGFGIRALVSLLVILLLFQLDGGLETLRMWGSIAVVLGCYAMARENNVRETEEAPPGVP
ncbi:hypothetical protein JDV09_24905 [Mycobacterium sp. Y57]|uniref:hypothetical protein n=1 Tax=Mycolicibacterium xanthum TaxID=2796469 RepID=UPI001C85DD43|nr:hypothetical protein [Mycolicibacterium xanthum]MBX7435315.1 hypothetical protein [Mycolicibacterium xanthum]